MGRSLDAPRGGALVRYLVFDRVLICGDDAGPGVAVTEREAIFAPFRKAVDGGTGTPGLGIGLSLVARLAEFHGGRAWVEDRPGGGAAFRVSLSN